MTVFLAEALIMLFFDYLPIPQGYLEALLDALLLSVIVFPALFFFQRKKLGL